MRISPPSLRQSVLLFSTLIGLFLFGWIYFSIPIDSLRIIRLSEYSSFISIIFLYLSLLISPLYTLFPMLPWKAQSYKARRAIGVTGWAYALAHSVVGFFGQLGGVAGIIFLSQNYLAASLLGLGALLIYTWMAITSTHVAIVTLGFKTWKLLHRCTYVATILVVIHVLMLGTHFRNFSDFIPSLFLFALWILLFLELFRFVTWVCKLTTIPRLVRGLYALLLVVSSLVITWRMWKVSNILSVHPPHVAQSHPMHESSTVYKLVTQAPALLVAGQPIPVSLQVLDWSTREPLSSFEISHEKFMHLVVVNDRLDSFAHYHPERQGNTFAKTLTFKEPGTYYLFATITPTGKQEVTVSTTMNVSGEKKRVTPSKQDSVLITMTTAKKISGEKFAAGESPIMFHVEDASTSDRVASLDQYLGALGHLVMINKETLEYIHIHPTIENTFYQLQDPKKRIVPFSPPVGHAQYQAGKYRLFAEFSVNGSIHVQQFDLTIE